MLPGNNERVFDSVKLKHRPTAQPKNGLEAKRREKAAMLAAGREHMRRTPS
jgi:hypothetical protein